MKISKIDEYFRGWYIGNFEPSCYKTEKFEVGIVTHKKGEKWPTHFHKISIEINLILEGEIIVNDKKLIKGDIFIIEPNEISNPVFLTDCKLVVVKTPSIPGDKYIV